MIKIQKSKREDIQTNRLMNIQRRRKERVHTALIFIGEHAGNTDNKNNTSSDHGWYFVLLIYCKTKISILFIPLHNAFNYHSNFKSLAYFIPYEMILADLFALPFRKYETIYGKIWNHGRGLFFKLLNMQQLTTLVVI